MRIPSLDEAGRRAAGEALTATIDSADSVSGPHGVEATVVSRFVGVHPNGAEVVMVIRGSDANFASAAVEALVAFALEQSRVLDGWFISGVGADPLTGSAG